MDFLKIWWVSHISHSKTQNSSIDTIPLSLIVLETFHKNDFSTLTLNAVLTPQIWKRGKMKKTRISYFSVLYNISKNRNDRRRTPKILSLLVIFERPNIPPPDLTQILVVDLVARSALFTLVCCVNQEQTSIKGTLDSAWDGEMVYFWGSGHEWSNKRASFHDGINARLFYKLDQREERSDQRRQLTE